jgi:2-oxoglutarate dehydrogenase E1 component
MTADDVAAMKAAFARSSNEEFEAGTNYKPNKADWLDGRWAGFRQRRATRIAARQTGVNSTG